MLSDVKKMGKGKNGQVGGDTKKVEPLAQFHLNVC